MILFLIAYILLLPLTIINYIVVLFNSKDHAKKYFKTTAINMDKFGNREFRTLWNKTLIKKTDMNSETLEKLFRQH